ncbi:Ger(x)C family spore germination protein [Fodinisporobacter ferrooxydans]|uniref:Ger(X)C family spore germination protein n=1 Tax=Fodinisporobacter ferrooxydans TaxID=2901836 RepID=A0ABY4CMQ1_9BACL|nr:Ger(x)C family spore germination protein [Alicyclobacillaceae bacterium MYW30-H2]
MKKMIWLAGMSMIVSALLLTGCWDQHELEDFTYITTVGLDQGKNGKIQVTLQSASPQGATSQGGGGKGEGPTASETVTYLLEGPLTAKFFGNTTVSRRYSFEHTNVLIVGEALVRTHDILRFLSSALRDHSFRRDMLLIVTEGKAKEFIYRNQPLLEQTPYKFFEMIYPLWQTTGLWPNIRLHSFLRTLEGGQGLPITILSSYQDPQKIKIRDKGSNKQPSSSSFNSSALPVLADSNGNQDLSKSDNYLYGDQFRLKGGNPVELMGTAVFGKKYMIGKLGTVDTQLLLMIQGESEEIYRNFANPLKPKSKYGVALTLFQSGSPDIKMQWNGNHLKSIQEKVELNAKIVAIQSGDNFVTNTKNRLKLEKFVNYILSKQANALVKRFQTKYKGDPFHFEWKARHHFLYTGDWKTYDWGKAFCQADVKVDVHVKILTAGKQLENPRR